MRIVLMKTIPTLKLSDPTVMNDRLFQTTDPKKNREPNLSAYTLFGSIYFLLVLGEVLFFLCLGVEGVFFLPFPSSLVESASSVSYSSKEY